MTKQLIASVVLIISAFLIAILTSNLNIEMFVLFSAITIVYCVTVILITIRLLKLNEVEK